MRVREINAMIGAPCGAGVQPPADAASRQSPGAGLQLQPTQVQEINAMISAPGPGVRHPGAAG
jgi:hypothetical protein